MNILVLAAGENSRFNGTLKQLLPVGRDTILGRIDRQLKVRGLSARLVTHQSELAEKWEAWNPHHVLNPPQHRWIVETLLSVEPWWSLVERTVVLLGDVLYSKDTLDRLLQSTDPVVFIGNRTELFGMAFAEDQQEAVQQSLQQEVDAAMAGDIGKLQSLYWRVTEQPYNTVRTEESPMLLWVRDWTLDVDSLAGYDLAQAIGSPRLEDDL